MASKSRQAGSTKAKITAPRSWTPNRVVAHNLELARKRKHWTQSETVEQLRRFGLAWSRSNYAMSVPTAARGGRAREFNADELVAFAQVFDTTVAMLFMPPYEVSVAVPGGTQTLDINDMRKLAWPTDPPPPRNQREARLAAQVQKDIFNFLFQKLGYQPGKPPRPDPSAEQVSEMGEELAEMVEHTLKRAATTRRKYQSRSREGLRAAVPATGHHAPGRET
jgi:hypothetical protein